MSFSQIWIRIDPVEREWTLHMVCHTSRTSIRLCGVVRLGSNHHNYCRKSPNGLQNQGLDPKSRDRWRKSSSQVNEIQQWLESPILTSFSFLPGKFSEKAKQLIFPKQLLETFFFLHIPSSINLHNHFISTHQVSKP